MRSLPVLISGALLGLFGVLGAGLVGLSHEGTAARIAENERQILLQQLETLVPAGRIDNNMLEDLITVSAPARLGAASTRVYRARRGGEPVALVLSPVVTQGYSGPIRLIVAVDHDGSVAGVRVLSHRETPGLGDKIEVERSDWVLGFDGRSLLDPPAADWQVKRDGGAFDQFTGATITPRAIVRGVKAALVYVRDHRETLFETPTTAESNDG
jgi:electron transport complex protein RnfG